MYQKYLVLALVVACGDVSLQFAACEVQVVIAAVGSDILHEGDAYVVANDGEVVGLGAHIVACASEDEGVVAHLVDVDGQLCHGVTVQRSREVVAIGECHAVRRCHRWRDADGSCSHVVISIDAADGARSQSIHRTAVKR